MAPPYSGKAHVAFLIVFCSSGIVLSLLNVQNLKQFEWLTVPISFLYSNLVEYLAHRYPMHHRWKVISIAYDRHTGLHHRFFTHEKMNIDQWKEVRAILFPASLVILFFGIFLLPVLWGLSVLVSTNVAWLFSATAFAYYFLYEALHLTYHLNLPGVECLRLLHRIHHNPRLMRQVNFNITFPICDWVFETYSKSREPDSV